MIYDVKMAMVTTKPIKTTIQTLTIFGIDSNNIKALH